MNMPVKRLPAPEPTQFPAAFAWDEAAYWQSPDDGAWMLWLPSDDGGDFGNLKGHQVTEHDDGTITVAPSILITSTRPGARRRHGYLRRGVWEPCSDDLTPVAPPEGGEG